MLPRFVLFLLRPFAKPIRYGLLKYMKRSRKPDDGRPVIATSEYLINEFVLPSTFQLFQDAQFRNLASFSTLSTSEHDRIFNELLVASMRTLILCLEGAPGVVRPEYFHFWKEVQEQIPKQFQREFMKFGVSSQNAKLMRELIDMRGQEYGDLSRQAREINELENKSFREFSDDLRHIAVTLQGMSVGIVLHIKRGKHPPGDPLIKFLMSWFFDFYRRLTGFVKKL